MDIWTGIIETNEKEIACSFDSEYLRSRNRRRYIHDFVPPPEIHTCTSSYNRSGEVISTGIELDGVSSNEKETDLGEGFSTLPRSIIPVGGKIV